jgi:hypothetical protein
MPLRAWLLERSELERATLARLWALPGHGEADDLADGMLRPEAVASALAGLAAAERGALARVLERGGVIPAPILEREFGRIRSHEAYTSPRAYLMSLRAPPSPTERLFLLGLIQPLGQGAGRAYAVPPDLLPLLPEVAPRATRLQLHPAQPPSAIRSADAALLERHLLELLVLAYDGQLELVHGGGLTKAALVRLARRWGQADDFTGVTREEQWPYAQFVRQLAIAAGLVRPDADARLQVTRDAVAWLGLPRIERLGRLLAGWVESSWDELAALEGIRAERAYARDLPGARRALLRLIAQAPAGEWVDLGSFAAQVKRVEPDYARPDGDYGRWRLRSRANLSLDGFGYWEAVEGAQIRAVLGYSLRWLGLVDVGLERDEPSRFRVNGYGGTLLQGGPAPVEPAEEPLVVQPNFEVIAPLFVAPYARFQLGRIAEGGAGDQATAWRLTRRSIQAARQRGIELPEIVNFLEGLSGRELPQNVAATLEEWAGGYGQISLRRGWVLEARDAALLEQVRRDRRVRMPEAERLGETAWLVREGDIAGVVERLRRAGYGLAEHDRPADGALSEHDLAVVMAALEFYAGAAELLGMPEASGGTRRRVARLVPERQLNRAHRASAEALRRLRERFEEGAASAAPER